jgi:hypothetical protein
MIEGMESSDVLADLVITGKGKINNGRGIRISHCGGRIPEG